MKLSSQQRLMFDFVILREATRKRICIQLTPKDERLLEIVGLAYMRQERLSVTDLMGEEDLGSPAAIHSRIKTLAAADWITFLSTVDRRRYQVTPTDKSLTYFDALGKVIETLHLNQGNSGDFDR